jgi:hypothetical protein
MNIGKSTSFATDFAHSLSIGGKVDDDFMAISRVSSLEGEYRTGP